MKKNILNRKDLKPRILKVIEGPKITSLATIVNGKPWVRLVMCYNQGLKLYICTYRDSRKVSQIKQNSNVHLVISQDINNLTASYVQVAGKANIRSTHNIRHKFWHDFMRKYYRGPDDPNYVVIEIKPELIEYRTKELEQHQIYKI